MPHVAHPMLRRMAESSGARARLYGAEGALLVDTRVLEGPGGPVRIGALPPPRPMASEQLAGVLGWLDRVVGAFRAEPVITDDGEPQDSLAFDLEEVTSALSGNVASVVRTDRTGRLVIGAAAPIRVYGDVPGAVLLTETAGDIDAAVRAFQLGVLKVFAAALAVTVLLSLYLSWTIGRPLVRLASAAERVRRDRNLQHDIPAFAGRNDEIGELARALRQMTGALRLRMDAIERFAADVSHEIKNPLSSLRSAVESVARVQDPERRLKLLAIVESDVRRIDRLISDISDSSRLDTELSRTRAELTDIAPMLETLLKICEHRAASRGIRLNLRISQREALTVRGIGERLMQVFENVLSNALSFSPRDSTVTLSGWRSGSDVVVVVTDQGPGIPPGKESQIFERFYSERPASDQPGVHSGLGLSISLQIVEAHGGLIRADHARDDQGSIVGAVFEIRLPAA